MNIPCPFPIHSLPLPRHRLVLACDVQSFSILITEPAAEAPSCACWSVAALCREGWRARNKPRPGPPRQARSSRPVRCSRASVIPLGRFGGPVHADAGTAGRCNLSMPLRMPQVFHGAPCKYCGFLTRRRANSAVFFHFPYTCGACKYRCFLWYIFLLFPWVAGRWRSGSGRITRGEMGRAGWDLFGLSLCVAWNGCRPPCRSARVAVAQRCRHQPYKAVRKPVCVRSLGQLSRPPQTLDWCSPHLCGWLGLSHMVGLHAQLRV